VNGQDEPSAQAYFRHLPLHSLHLFTNTTKPQRIDKHKAGFPSNATHATQE